MPGRPGSGVSHRSGGSHGPSHRRAGGAGVNNPDNPHAAAYDSDEEQRFGGTRQVNMLALDKWSTDQLLVLKQQGHVVHPDGVLIDKTAIIVTGHQISGEFSRTHFETLHEAVEASEEGQIIVLQAGRHSVGSRAVMLDKRLKVEGVRNLKSIPDPHALVPRIRDQDRLKNPDTTKTDLEYETSQARVFSDYGTPAIIIAGSGIEVVGLTVMQRINYKLKEENRPQGDNALCAVEINGGSCVFRECNFSSDGGIAVKVRGGASPLFSKCTFEFAKLQGLWFGSRATGRVEDCRILSCTEANLQIEGLADPMISRCKIYESFACGVRVTDRGKGLFTDNDIFGSVAANVRVDDEAEPIFRNNYIHDGRVEGVSVLSNGIGYFERNDISCNGSSGVVILSGAEPTMVLNTIHRNRVHGLHITGEGNGTIKDNDIFQNVLAGVYIESGSNPTICHNRISNGLGTGITVADEGEGTIEDNDIFLNKLCGVEVKSGARPVVRVNRIYEGVGVGVRVGEEGGGRFLDNQVVK